jgi:tRNA pseudouridine55 synthase
MMSSTGGLILLNKPSGITSFRGLNALKKSLGTGKVGHTGTLDKFADGLIISLFGKMTKLVPEFTGMDKEYIALISFGAETETLDPEGKILYTADAPELNQIERAIPDFIGNISQTPPQYSAIHINGKRAYELARAGKEVEIPTRQITVNEFEILSYEKPYLKVRINCSKGTYIRSIARDLAIQCGSRAHLIELKRTIVGPFKLSQAVNPDEFSPLTDVLTPWDIFDYINNVDKEIISGEYINNIKIGKEQVLAEVGKNFTDNREYALFNSEREMVALVKKNHGKLSYRFVC